MHASHWTVLTNILEMVVEFCAYHQDDSPSVDEKEDKKYRREKRTDMILV